MHQNAANRVRPQAAFLISSAVDALGNADRLWLFPLIRKLGRVMKHKNRAVGGGHPVMGRLKMAGQNVRFADPLIREKAVGCLGVGPILADQGNEIGRASCRARVEQYGGISVVAVSLKKKKKKK